MAPSILQLVFPTALTSLASLELVFFALALVATFSLCLYPGGLAWGLTRSKSPTAIPGPLGYPLIGLVNVFNGLTPHRTLAILAKTFKAKSLMAFSLGFTRFVISSDPDTAKEMLSNSAFADRPIKESAYELLFHRAMGFAPYGEYWRNLRKISATHLFSPSRIGSFEPFRRDMGLKMVEQIKTLMKKDGEVQIKKILHCGSLNNVMKTVFGKTYDFGREGAELEELVREGYELLGIFNWGDHIPLLRWLDFQGVRSRCRCLVSKVNVFVGSIIEEHRTRRLGSAPSDSLGDFVDVLLDLEKDHKLDASDMIAVLWELIFRGTDTVAILLEWVLARMVLHQDIQVKVQAEIDSVVPRSRAVSDSDIAKMPYLQAIVKETLRVHPPGPLLSWARLAIHDVHVGTTLIPAGTTAMVNMWSITHDPNIWSNPEKFDPERFMTEEVSVLGSDLRLAPFGSGRRVCPGKALGLATVHLWLAQLLQQFNWLPGIDGDVDLTECLKLSMEMKKPLVCAAVTRNG